MPLHELHPSIRCRSIYVMLRYVKEKARNTREAHKEGRKEGKAQAVASWSFLASRILPPPHSLRAHPGPALQLANHPASKLARSPARSAGDKPHLHAAVNHT